MTTIIDTTAWFEAKKIIPFDSSLSFIMIDIERIELENYNNFSNGMMKTLVDFTVFTHLMFLSRKYETQVCLIQKKCLIPTREKKPMLNQGFYILAAFPSDILNRYFPLVLKCAIAVNIGLISKHNALTKSFTDIASDLDDFNVYTGIPGIKCPLAEKCEPQIGCIKTLFEFDRYLHLYHLITSEEETLDVSGDCWEKRCEYLSPSYLFKNTKRMGMRYNDLYSLGNCIQNKFEIPNNLISLAQLKDQKILD